MHLKEDVFAEATFQSSAGLVASQVTIWRWPVSGLLKSRLSTMLSITPCRIILSQQAISFSLAHKPLFLSVFGCSPQESVSRYVFMEIYLKNLESLDVLVNVVLDMSLRGVPVDGQTWGPNTPRGCCVAWQKCHLPPF